jgi:hypothetical protein
MSEYQYFEFQAIDRPLTEDDRQALRALSSRARITATSFINTYEWGDFKGDPVKLMQTWFDLHLYVANWGSRRLMLRFPKRLIDTASLGAFLAECDWVTIRQAGANVIIDISPDEDDRDGGDFDDGSGWLAALAPLRADVLGGDLRLFYLLWLVAVQDGAYDDDITEPMPGLGPMTGSLEAFVNFFGLDTDLVAAAAERRADWADGSQEAARRAIANMSDTEKTQALLRFLDGDPHVAADLRAAARASRADHPAAAASGHRTVGEVLARAEEIATDRVRVAAAKRAADKRRHAEQAEQARRARLLAVKRRGESAWRDVEADIEQRNAAAYDRAASLLEDLRAIAEEHGSADEFARRLRTIRERHAQKKRFIERLAAMG